MIIDSLVFKFQTLLAGSTVRLLRFQSLRLDAKCENLANYSSSVHTAVVEICCEYIGILTTMV